MSILWRCFLGTHVLLEGEMWRRLISSVHTAEVDGFHTILATSCFQLLPSVVSLIYFNFQRISLLADSYLVGVRMVRGWSVSFWQVYLIRYQMMELCYARSKTRVLPKPVGKEQRSRSNALKNWCSWVQLKVLCENRCLDKGIRTMSVTTTKMYFCTSDPTESWVSQLVWVV